MSDKHVTIYQKECMLKDIYNMLIEHIYNDFDSISNIDSSIIFIVIEIEMVYDVN